MADEDDNARTLLIGAALLGAAAVTLLAFGGLAIMATNNTTSADGPELAAEWRGGDEHRWSEAKKIRALDPRMRGPIKRVLARLRAAGHDVQLYYTWRNLDTQAAIERAGHSTVKFSFHNALSPTGAPAALAADIVHAVYGWGNWGTPSPARDAEMASLWRDVGQFGKDEGLFWGGDWRSLKDLAHLEYFDGRAGKLAAVRAQSLPIWSAIA